MHRTLPGLRLITYWVRTLPIPERNVKESLAIFTLKFRMHVYTIDLLFGKLIAAI